MKIDKSIKININIIAHDGVTSLYTGVGRMVLDSISVLTRKNILPFKYTVNAITGKYSKECLGYSEKIKQLSTKSIQSTGGDIYECINTSSGNVSYGTPNHWNASSISAATIIKIISSKKTVNINLCFDTPFASVPKHFQQYQDTNNIFVWIPHSTGKLHKIDSAINSSESYSDVRLKWEQDCIDYVNMSNNSYVGYIGEFMKKHLSKMYKTHKNKLIDFTNGLDIDNERYANKLSQKQIEIILKKNDIPTNLPLVLAFGRLEPYKGFYRVIKIGGKLDKYGYKTLLLSQPYSKNDPLINKYKLLMRKYNPNGIFLYEKFTFDLPHILMQWHNTKILLIPSMVEPFGLIVNEARMYRNTNVLIAASNVDGLPEQINNGVDGFLIDFNQIENAVQKLLEMSKERNNDFIKITSNGYQRVLKNYDLKNNLSHSILHLINICKK